MDAVNKLIILLCLIPPLIANADNGADNHPIKIGDSDVKALLYMGRPLTTSYTMI